MNIHRNNQQPWLALLLGVVGLGIAAQIPALAGRATRVADAIWVHDSLYGTVATDTAFKSPPEHSTDVIFSFMGSGLEGQRSVAVYAPGDAQYNGGRWHVMAVAFTDTGRALFDPDGDGAVNLELTNAEDLVAAAEMGFLTISDTTVRFECPLLPQPNQR